MRVLKQRLLWAAALGLTGWLAYSRWRTWSGEVPAGVDFRYLFSAAGDIAAGQSPYLIRWYVYPPPLALLLAPFAHAHVLSVWKVWLAVIVAAPFAGLAAFQWLIRGPMAWWLRPVGFGVFGLTLLYGHYYPLSRDLALGQTDTILFSLLVLAAVAAARGAPRSRGAMLGLAGVVKVWPWLLVLGLLRPDGRDRRRALLSAAALALLAPVSALAFGWSGLTGWLSNDLHASGQKLVSDSVWGMPKLLFSHTGLAQPVVASTALRYLLTAILAIWVILLLLTVLRTRADGALRTWNLIFCVILLLPASHRQYALLVLPLLWWWAQRSVTAPDRRSVAVAVALALWWLLQTFAWPYNGSSHAITSLRYSVPFFGDLVALSASVLGALLLRTSAATETERAQADTGDGPVIASPAPASVLTGSVDEAATGASRS